MSNKSYFERLQDGEVLPSFREDLKVDANMKPEEKQRRLDARTDILANILAAYPTTDTKKLAEEYGLKPSYISAVARQHGIRKVNPRSTASNAVEKLDLKGHIVASYESINKAAIAEGVNYHSIERRCKGIDKTPLNGFRYRFNASTKKRRRSNRLSFLEDDPFDLSGWEENELY